MLGLRRVSEVTPHYLYSGDSFVLLSFFPRNAKQRKQQRKPTTPRLFLEQLEDRVVPSTFTVSNLLDGGNGSLRKAILDANAHAGADVINFSVAGTILLTSGALPTITGPL